MVPNAGAHYYPIAGIILVRALDEITHFH
jgi:hypothetical protein